MPTHPTRNSAEFMAKVALDALSESKTLAKLASEYRIRPTQVTRWKQEMIENATDLFVKGKKKEVNHKAEVAKLHRQIGKLKVENDFLSHLPGLSAAVSCWVCPVPATTVVLLQARGVVTRN
jgi:transposase-like protein